MLHDLLSLGVLRPVPEQYLRISLTRVESPLRTLQHPAPQLVFLHTKGITPWIPPGLPSTRREQHTLDPTRSSFYTKGTNTQESVLGMKPLDQAYRTLLDLKLRTEKEKIYNKGLFSELKALSQIYT
ncbi:hypothetical protein Taro_048378 [Colocasia esculenta]|uniref:Uncharacterized protein n=1 Tax=Colocasia esculenta TaxID=4460 RepID=A0A843WVN6_COLES|nr:hypothetical protein [Colocasia esculenta]